MANEQRLIDAFGLTIRLEKENAKRPLHYDDVLAIIADENTVDAAEVVHGRWEKAHITGYLKCNCCKDAFIYKEWLENGKWNYCPNCGAKMDGGNGDE